MKEVTIDTALFTEVRFKVDEDDLSYMGTATFPGIDVPDEKTLNAQIDAQYEAWKLHVRTPAKAPTAEELEAMKLRAERDKAVAEKQIAELTAKLSAVAVEPVKEERK